MPIALLDSEHADLDLTSTVTVLTHTPSASSPMLCQGLIMFGDGAKDLAAVAGNFEFIVTVGGQTIQPSPDVISFSGAVRAAAWTAIFPVPANLQVVIRVKSPNAADSDVDVTAYLFEAATTSPVTLDMSQSVGGAMVSHTVGAALQNADLNLLAAGFQALLEAIDNITVTDRNKLLAQIRRTHALANGNKTIHDQATPNVHTCKAEDDSTDLVTRTYSVAGGVEQVAVS